MPVSTRDKLRTMSDGKVHLGWLVDAKIVEFEECMKEFYTALNNIPKDIDGVTRLQDADEVLHNYSKKLISIAREIPMEEDLVVGGMDIPQVLENMLNAKTATESLGITQEKLDEIINKCIFGDSSEDDARARAYNEKIGLVNKM